MAEQILTLVCTICGKVKEAEAFPKRIFSSGNIGRRKHCRECLNIKARPNARSKETIKRDEQRQRMAADPEYAKQVRLTLQSVA
jgi:hypothetical protein